MSPELIAVIIPAAVSIACAVISAYHARKSVKAKNDADILIQQMKQDHEKDMIDRKSNEDRQNKFDTIKYTAITNYFEYAQNFLNNPHSDEAKFRFLGSVSKILPYANDDEKQELLRLDALITQLSQPLDYDAIQRIQQEATPLFTKLCTHWSNKLPLCEGKNSKN